MTHSSALSLDRFMLMSPKPTVDMTSELHHVCRDR